MKVLRETSYIKKYNFRDDREKHYKYMVQLDDGMRYLIYTQDKAERVMDTIDIAKSNGILIKPIDMEIYSSISCLTEAHIAKGYWREKEKDTFFFPKVEEMEGTPADYGLYIPQDYPKNEIHYEIKKSDDISDEMVEKITTLAKDMNMIIIGEDYSDIANAEGSMDVYNARILCPKCKHVFVNNFSGYESKCPICGKENYSSDMLIDEDFKNHRIKNFDIDMYYRLSFTANKPKHTGRIFYMEAIENGIKLYRIKYEIVVKKGVIKESFSTEYSVEHVIDGEMKAYKHLKKGKRECDVFEALNINTKNINSLYDIVFDAAEDFLEFAQNNEKILRMMGFIDVMKYSSDNVWNIESFFVVFLAIINKYPVIEKLVKMGYAKLFFDLYQSFEKCQNKEEIGRKVEELGQLINNEAIKGKDAIRLPQYIGKYLIEKNAKINEFMYWRDVFEITNLSKENFESLINSFNFAYVNSQVNLSNMANILKYGYEPDKLNSYLIKAAKKTKENILHVKELLADYLSMCELMDIEPDKFPQDLKKQHDDITEAYKQIQNAGRNKLIEEIGKKCEKYFTLDDESDQKGVPKILQDYIVVFPKCEKDFIEEGNMQHNCVGSYASHVASGWCIIFFLRKKDEPNKSFITGECRKEGIGQFYYSNNRSVYDENLRSLGKYICNKIVRGCKAGNIPGLQNIKNV